MLYVLKFYLQGSPRERGDGVLRSKTQVVFKFYPPRERGNHGAKRRNSFSTQFLSYLLTAQSNR